MEVSDILAAVDIVEYIAQYCDLEERSDGEFWGLSPLKDENTPSFSVNPEKQTFYDFSSGHGGNVLEFCRRYHNCSVGKAVNMLKTYAHIDDNTPIQTGRLAATNIARKFKPQAKRTNQPLYTVLQPDIMDRYDRDLSKLAVWEAEGITLESMDRFCVRYDPVSDRLVYPIRSAAGDILNIGGRTLDPDYKAKKLRKYTYFHSWGGSMNLIYGLYENMEFLRAKKEIILFEGAKSVLVADGWGVKNTGAVLTSHVNPGQFKLLIQLGCSVVFAFDSEVDVRMDANAMRLIPYVPVYWMKNRDSLLDDKDAPVDKGFEVFQKLYNSKIRLR